MNNIGKIVSVTTALAGTERVKCSTQPACSSRAVVSDSDYDEADVVALFVKLIVLPEKGVGYNSGGLGSD